MDTTQALRLGRELMAQHGLAGWTISYDRAEIRSGLCKYGPKQITLGRAFVASAGEPAVRNVILHEIAHALVGAYVVRYGRRVRSGHGPEWKELAISIGCDGERCNKDNPHAQSVRERQAAEAYSAAGVTLGDDAWTGSAQFPHPTAVRGDKIAACGLVGRVEKVANSRYHVKAVRNGREGVWTVPFATAKFVVAENGAPVERRTAPAPRFTPKAPTVTFRKDLPVVINFPGNAAHGLTGKVVRVNQKTVSIETDRGSFRVSPNLLRVA
ncbi:SprT-like domain-containing protein [Agromyces humi]|uniref:SprT-like domain-containing protein n=1 Tax=Agromyces humi TaxID=1766800 RepID=UPI001358FB98|nr:SprT-like domain-containing protein [Agromyces humi]